MEIQTKRLLLTKYKKTHEQGFKSLFTDREVMKYVDRGALSETKAEKFWDKVFNEKFRSNRRIWAVTGRENSEFIGHALMNPRPAKKEDWEFGFILLKKFWGIGFATEMAKALVEFGFDSEKLGEIYATVDDDNTASINVLKKVGLEFVRHEFDDQGRFSVYGIVKN